MMELAVTSSRDGKATTAKGRAPSSGLFDAQRGARPTFASAVSISEETKRFATVGRT